MDQFQWYKSSVTTPPAFKNVLGIMEYELNGNRYRRYMIVKVDASGEWLITTEYPQDKITWWTFLPPMPDNTGV